MRLYRVDIDIRKTSYALVYCDTPEQAKEAVEAIPTFEFEFDSEESYSAMPLVSPHAIAYFVAHAQYEPIYMPDADQDFTVADLRRMFEYLSRCLVG